MMTEQEYPQAKISIEAKKTEWESIQSILEYALELGELEEDEVEAANGLLAIIKGE